MTKGKRQNSYTERTTIGSCSRWDACSFLHTHATGDRETLRKEVGDARRSRLEQASSSMPKVKEQTDVKSSNSLEASPATGAKKPLSMRGKMKKIVVRLSASSRVSWLQVWKQMHLWHQLPISTCWWWEETESELEKGRYLRSSCYSEGKKGPRLCISKLRSNEFYSFGKLEK